MQLLELLHQKLMLDRKNKFLLLLKEKAVFLRKGFMPDEMQNAAFFILK